MSTALGPCLLRGQFIANGLVYRAIRVAACLKAGPPVWETTKPPGYTTFRTRCARCKTLRTQHIPSSEAQVC